MLYQAGESLRLGKSKMFSIDERPVAPGDLRTCEFYAWSDEEVVIRVGIERHRSENKYESTIRKIRLGPKPKKIIVSHAFGESHYATRMLISTGDSGGGSFYILRPRLY